MDIEIETSFHFVQCAHLEPFISCRPINIWPFHLVFFSSLLISFFHFFSHHHPPPPPLSSCCCSSSPSTILLLMATFDTGQNRFINHSSASQTNLVYILWRGGGCCCCCCCCSWPVHRPDNCSTGRHYWPTVLTYTTVLQYKRDRHRPAEDKTSTPAQDTPTW